MLSPQAILKGIVSRILPNSPNPDNQNIDVALRMGRYGEAAILSMVRKSHLLADEGSYFVANSGQTGLAEFNNTAFTAVNPFLIIQNNDSPGGKRIYLDYLALVTTLAGSAASGLTAIQAAVVLDSILRYSSASTINGSAAGGASIVSPNMDLAAPKSIATVFAGPLVAVAAGALARQICGLRTLRPTVSGTVADVVGELKLLNFGGVEGATGSCTVGNANVLPQAFPPIVIGPQQSALIYIWQATGTTNVVANYAPELGWWER